MLSEYQRTADKSVRLYKRNRKSWLCVKNDFGMKPGLLKELRGLTRSAIRIADNEAQRTAGVSEGRGYLRVRMIDDRPVAESRAVTAYRWWLRSHRNNSASAYALGGAVSWSAPDNSVYCKGALRFLSAATSLRD